MDYRSAKKLKKNDIVIEKKSKKKLLINSIDKFKHHGKKYIMIDTIDDNGKHMIHTHLEVE